MVVAAPLVACTDGPQQPELIVDSVGVEFHWYTDHEYDFGPTDDAPEPRDCGEDSEAGWSYSWGRFVSICMVCGFETGGWSTAPLLDCRVLVCDSDADCPYLSGYDPVCENGICQNSERLDAERVGVTDVYELCAHDVDRYEILEQSGYETVNPRLLELDCDAETHACALPLPDGCLQP